MTDGTRDQAAREGTGRAVLATALRLGGLAVVLIAVVGVGLGALVAGAPGVWGALAGAALAAVFLGITAGTLLATAGSSTTVAAGALMGGWLLKVIAVMAVLAVLAGVEGYSRGALFLTLVASVLAMLAVDSLVVLRGRLLHVVPQDAVDGPDAARARRRAGRADGPHTS